MTWGGWSSGGFGTPGSRCGCQRIRFVWLRSQICWIKAFRWKKCSSWQAMQTPEPLGFMIADNAESRAILWSGFRYDFRDAASQSASPSHIGFFNTRLASKEMTLGFEGPVVCMRAVRRSDRATPYWMIFWLRLRHIREFNSRLCHVKLLWPFDTFEQRSCCSIIRLLPSCFFPRCFQLFAF